MTLTKENRYKAFIFRFLSSGFFISYAPAAILKNRKNTGAGFWGTVLALVLTPLLPSGNFTYLLFLIIFTVFSVWICKNVDFKNGKHDDPRIVIDEICGFWFAVAFLPKTLPVLAACFVIFRFLDTVKPFFIKKLDKLNSGFAVVADDVASGVLTNILVQIALLFIHYYNLMR